MAPPVPQATNSTSQRARRPPRPAARAGGARARRGDDRLRSSRTRATWSRSPVRGGARPAAHGEKYVILVVEDDPDLAQLVIDIFMTRASRCTGLEQGRDQPADERRPSVDLVLLDILLPDTHGLDVLSGSARTEARAAPGSHHDGEVHGPRRGAASRRRRRLRDQAFKMSGLVKR